MSNREANDTVAVALLYQNSQLGGHLKDALNELGAKVVYEALAADLDLDTLQHSGAGVVVVNLDAETDTNIDHVYDLLDTGDFSVVFNDAAASAPLKGWDHARWARHLAAKILKRPEVVSPPRPPGAQAVPTPVQKSMAAIPDFGMEPVVAPPAVSDAAAMRADALSLAPSEPVVLPSVQEDAIDLGGMPVEAFTHISDTLLNDATPALEREDEFDFGSALEDQAHEFEAGHPELTLADDELANQNFERGFAHEIEALFAQTDEPITEQAEFATSPAQELKPALDEHWQTFSDEDQEPVLGTLTIIGSGVSPEKEEADIPLTLDLVDQAAAEVPISRDTKLFMSETSAKAAPSDADIILPPDWLLEPLEEGEAPAPAKPTATGANADFGIERISAGEFLAPVVEETAKHSPALPEPSFDLELMPLEEAMAPEVSYESESWLDSPAKVVAPQKPMVRPDPPSANIQHVFVLCASIGGPEAVREFLSALPPRFPALFVLAQHMSEEFLEMMAAQLAKTTPLTVRTPSHGERVGHGDILVVPTTRRLQVDVDGVVVLSQLLEIPSASPSIGLVLHDMADAFGAKVGAIVFSGMAPDAVEGCQHIADRGGLVWAQDPSTCVLSSMVDEARAAGVVNFIGTPAQLAKNLIAQAKQW